MGSTGTVGSGRMSTCIQAKQFLQSDMRSESTEKGTELTISRPPGLMPRLHDVMTSVDSIPLHVDEVLRGKATALVLSATFQPDNHPLSLPIKV